MGDKDKIVGGKRSVLLAGLAGAAVIVTAAPAEATQQVRAFDIAAGPLGDALAAYARITRRQLLYSSTLVSGRRAGALHGRFSDDQALRRLLDGSGIEVRQAGKAFILVRRPTPQPQSAAVRPRAKPRAARSQPAPAARRAGADAAAQESDETVVVTGSNIRGISEGASQVIVVDRSEIERAGHGTVGDAIAALPQNFGGTGTEDTSLTAADQTTQNIGLGTSANLRGLGSDATLILVNGRRMPGSGGQADFTDISLIPLAAVERVEVLTDGASALYGSDAVGGVINIILRKSLEGGESRLRLGTTTRGGAGEVQAGQVLGVRWAGGHLLAAYEYMHRSRLRADQRAFTRSADLRPLGGSDWRSYFATPGTLLAISPAGSLVPAFAIAPTKNGVGLTPSDFTPGQNYSNFREGTDVLPRQDRHSVYLSGAQQLSGEVELFTEARYARRDFESFGQATTTLAQVTPRNPYFYSPTGAPSALIGYSFLREIGPIRQPGSVDSWSVTAGATLRPLADWRVEAYATRAREFTRTAYANIVNTSLFAEAVGTVPDDPATPFNPAIDGYFNPYGNGSANSARILDFIRQGFAHNRTTSRLTTINIKADGKLFALPGGNVKVAVGANFRREGFGRSGENYFSGTHPTPLGDTDIGRSVGAGFAELALPLFGEANARAGMRRLQLSAALRHERYSDFGSTTNPKLGLIWEPAKGLLVKASYGTSYRAPVLREVRDAVQVSYVQLRDAAGVLTPVVTLFGGNPRLRPETAKTLSFNTRYVPDWAPRWRAEATWFQTDFRNRIERPAADNLSEALSDAIYSPYITRVDPAHDPADRARLIALIDDPGSLIKGYFPPEFYRAILDGRLVNSAQLRVRGIDLLVAGDLALGGGAASLSLNVSHMLDYQRRITPKAALVERVGTLSNPPAWRLRGTLGYDRGAWGGSATINHVAGYLDDVSNPTRAVGSWTTLDAQIRFAPATMRDAGWSVALSAQNLLDADPPFVDQLTGFGYGAASADPLGRFVSLQIVKRW